MILYFGFCKKYWYVSFYIYFFTSTHGNNFWGRKMSDRYKWHTFPLDNYEDDKIPKLFIPNLNLHLKSLKKKRFIALYNRARCTNSLYEARIWTGMCVVNRHVTLIMGLDLISRFFEEERKTSYTEAPKYFNGPRKKSRVAS